MASFLLLHAVRGYCAQYVGCFNNHIVMTKFTLWCY